jgi:hypothetical protein
VNAGPAATAATVTGLTPGATYSFQVVASNAIGPGTAGISGAVVIPGNSHDCMTDLALRSFANHGGQSSTTLSLSSAAQVGDLLLAVGDPYDPGNYNCTVSSGSGGAWTTVQAANGNGTTGQYMAVFSKLLAAGDTSVTVACGDAANFTLIDAFSVSGKTAYVAASAVGGAPAGTSATAPALTTPGAEELVILAAMQAGGTVATEPADLSQLTLNGSFFTGCYEMATAGAVPTQQVTNGDSSGPWQLIQLSLSSQ